MYAARDPIGVNSLYWGTAALSKCSLGSSRARLLRLLRARLSAPATPLPRVLELAASTVADDAAFDHIGTGLDGATWFSSEAKALVTGGCINIEMFPPGHYYSSKNEGNGLGGLTRFYNPAWFDTMSKCMAAQRGPSGWLAEAGRSLGQPEA